MQGTQLETAIGPAVALTKSIETHGTRESTLH